MKKNLKNTSQQRLRATIMVGVMVFFILFFSSFASAWESGLNSGLVSYYKLDETSGIVLDGLFRFNGTNDGATAGGAGIIGTAYDFEYTDSTDQIKLGNFSALPSTGGNVSFSLWVKEESFTGTTVPEYLIGGMQEGYGIYTKDVLGNITFGSVGINERVSNLKVQLGGWNHVVVVYDDTNNKLYFYNNGTSDSNNPITYDSTFSRGNLSLGYSLQSLSPYDGLIDEVGIWNRTLTSTEVTTLYNNGVGITYGEGIFSISIDLISPVNSYQELPGNITFIANNNISYGNFTNSTVYLWFSNGTLSNTNSTLISGNISLQTSLKIFDIDSENYLWNYKTCGVNLSLSPSCFTASSNFTLNINPYYVNSETYNISTYETKNEEFTINITTIPTVSAIGAFLHYNGTAYAAHHTCSGNYCIISKNIDIPLLIDGEHQNKSFFWQVTFFGSGLDSVTQNSTTRQQNVSNISLIDCGGTVTTTAVNFVIKNESTLSLISADFKSTFIYYLGSGIVTKSYAYSGSGANSYDFCINHNVTFITTSEIKIQNGTIIRNYLFSKEEYTNSLTTKNLFIPNSDSTNIIIRVRNQGLVPMSNVLVNISRFYPDENKYYQVESRKTDEFGQFISKLLESDASYKFEFYDVDNNILKTSDKITVVCYSASCILDFIIEDAEDYFGILQDLDLFTYSLLFNNLTNTFTFSWDDQRGESATIRLEVIRYTLNQSTIICNPTSTAKLSTLTCNVGDQSASYTAQVFRTIGNDERIIDILHTKVGDTVTTYGVEGLFWAFILLFTCVGIGSFNPTAGASFFGIGFIFLGLMGIISMPLPVFFAVTAITVVFVWAVNT